MSEPAGQGQQAPQTARLFFALWPDGAAREQLAALQPALVRQGARAVAPQNLHLTLAFLGNVTPVQRACMEAWADAINVAPFAMRFDRLGYWRVPKVVWAGPTSWPAELDRLAASLAEGMRQCGLQPDPRPYVPHLTLLRKARRLPASPPELSLDWQAKGFVLVESRSTPNGVVYEVRRHWDLSGG